MRSVGQVWLINFHNSLDFDLIHPAVCCWLTWFGYSLLIIFRVLHLTPQPVSWCYCSAPLFICIWAYSYRANFWDLTAIAYIFIIIAHLTFLPCLFPSIYAQDHASFLLNFYIFFIHPLTSSVQLIKILLNSCSLN